MLGIRSSYNCSFFVIAIVLFFSPLSLAAETKIYVFPAKLNSDSIVNNNSIKYNKLLGPNAVFDTINKANCKFFKNSSLFKLLEGENKKAPDGTLLFVMSVNNVEKKCIKEVGGYLLRFAVVMDVQLVDSITGQIIYSDTVRDSSQLYRLKSDYDLTKYLGKKMIALAAKLRKKIASDFKGERIVAKALRNITRRSFLLNKGRNAGLFPNSRLYSKTSKTSVDIVESYEDYSIARVSSKSKMPKKGELFESYSIALGNKNAAELTSVTRIVFAESCNLSQKELVFLQIDEKRLENSLLDYEDLKKDETLPLPIWQTILAKHATTKMLESGKFRMGFATAGKRAISKAKAEMEEAFTGIAGLESTFLVPDVGVNILISNFEANETRKGKINKEYFAKATVTVSLYRIYTGEILCSTSESGIKKEAIILATDGEMIHENQSLDLFSQQLIRGTMTLAFKKLFEKYSSETIRGKVKWVSRKEVGVKFTSNDSFYPGKIVQCGTFLAKIPLSKSSKKTPVYVCGKRIKLKSQNKKGQWICSVLEGEVKKGDMVFEYGVPSYKNIVRTKGLVQIKSIKQPSPQRSSMNNIELRDFLFARIAEIPEFRIAYSKNIRKKISRFDKIKFLKSSAYAIDADSEEEYVKWDNSLTPTLFVSYAINEAESKLISLGKTNELKLVNVKIVSTLNLEDKSGKALCKKLQFPLKKEMKIPKSEEIGASQIDYYLRGVIPKMLNFFAKKRIPLL